MGAGGDVLRRARCCRRAGVAVVDRRARRICHWFGDLHLGLGAFSCVRLLPGARDGSCAGGAGLRRVAQHLRLEHRHRDGRICRRDRTPWPFRSGAPDFHVRDIVDRRCALNRLSRYRERRLTGTEEGVMRHWPRVLAGSCRHGVQLVSSLRRGGRRPPASPPRAHPARSSAASPLSVDCVEKGASRESRET